MSGYSGVGKIVAFNFPWYIAALAGNAAGWLWFRNARLEGWLGLVCIAGIAAADFWLIASLAVSHFIYDQSPVSRGGWLAGIESARIKSVAILHAGQDEASVSVTRMFPAAGTRVFDFYDPGRNGSASLRRARGLGRERAEAIAPDRIPLESGSVDLGLLVFAAHEVRRPAESAKLFSEAARVLGGKGRLLVVEHLRDGWNFLAYGPGAFHFLPRRFWSAAFDSARLRVVRETACTPFVRVFELERKP